MFSILKDSDMNCKASINRHFLLAISFEMDFFFMIIRILADEYEQYHTIRHSSQKGLAVFKLESHG